MISVRQLLDKKGYDVLSVLPSNTVFETITKMAERGVGALLVIREEKLVGIVSERDYARKVILQGRRSQETTAEEIMTPEPFTVTPSQTVTECMELMTEKRIRHLPVVSEGKVIGIISIGDVVKSVISNQAAMIEQLETYITRG